MPVDVPLKSKAVRITRGIEIINGNAFLTGGAEFPGDTEGFGGLVLGNNYGDGSILRFRGGNPKIHKCFFTGNGDVLHRFTFAVIKDIGYVYVRGKGKVTCSGVGTMLGSW